MRKPQTPTNQYQAEQASEAIPSGKDLLVEGTNVLAVEVHQSKEDSSDLVFDLKLEANTPHPDRLRRNLDHSETRKLLAEISDFLPSGVAGWLLQELSRATAE